MPWNDREIDEKETFWKLLGGEMRDCPVSYCWQFRFTVCYSAKSIFPPAYSTCNLTPFIYLQIYIYIYSEFSYSIPKKQEQKTKTNQSRKSQFHFIFLVLFLLLNRLFNNGFQQYGSWTDYPIGVRILCAANTSSYSAAPISASVIAKFLSLLYSYLKISISKDIVPDEVKGREIHHAFPMTLFVPDTVRLDHRNLVVLKHWTWQFVITRPACSILMIALQMLGIYPNWLSWAFTIILNISVSLALYSLLVFYHVFAKELAPHKPLAKFLCIKGVVFFCFWQGIVLEMLVSMGIIRSNHFWLDVEHLEEAYQNVLVILEMVVFSILQKYAYSAAPYSGEVEAKILKKRE
ncbi:hypothetical protein DKX38_017039 [Salix brachista]|uniref:Transmembrane protein 184C n=1 Tax=Salix brachista TaxID=2182728 RepID=A0A5N5KU40_9ROSI|nr:hypothetical protein DKX38_017039 [Salix brachista]